MLLHQSKTANAFHHPNFTPLVTSATVTDRRKIADGTALRFRIVSEFSQGSRLATATLGWRRQRLWRSFPPGIFAPDGFSDDVKLEPVKTTINIPEHALADAMRFSGAKAKREAVVLALEDFSRRRRVEDFLKLAGGFPDFPCNDEIEAADLERNALLTTSWPAPFAMEPL
jgi:hypothetical protein